MISAKKIKHDIFFWGNVIISVFFLPVFVVPCCAVIRPETPYPVIFTDAYFPAYMERTGCFFALDRHGETLLYYPIECCGRSMNPGRSSRKRALTLPALDKRRTDENKTIVRCESRAWHQRIHRGHLCRFLRQKTRRPDRTISGMAAQGISFDRQAPGYPGAFFICGTAPACSAPRYAAPYTPRRGAILENITVKVPLRGM